MATRIEALVGYQLIGQINIGNEMIYHTSCQMKRLRPYELTPLKYNPSTPGSIVAQRDATVDDIKEYVNTNVAILDLEVEERLGGFLQNYLNAQDVTNGLQHFNVTQIDLDADRTALTSHNTGIKGAAALSNTFQALETYGNTLSLYKEKVELHVTPDDLSLYDRRITTYQDLLNAMAFELRGLSSYTGETKYKTVKDIKGIVNSRIQTAENFWSLVPNTQETQDMQTVLNNLKGDLLTATTLQELEALGVYVDTQVPQLPLVRRWWNY